MATKTTAELQRGDRVRLISGIVRTVGEIRPSGYVNYRNETIYGVYYQEPASQEWSGGNSAIASSEWEVQS